MELTCSSYKAPKEVVLDPNVIKYLLILVHKLNICTYFFFFFESCMILTRVRNKKKLLITKLEQISVLNPVK